MCFGFIKVQKSLWTTLTSCSTRKVHIIRLDGLLRFYCKVKSKKTADRGCRENRMLNIKVLWPEPFVGDLSEIYDQDEKRQ